MTYNSNNFRPRCCKFRHKDVCQCGEIWREHYPYHPHPVALRATELYTIPEKCAKFRPVDVDAVVRELVGIEGNLR